MQFLDLILALPIAASALGIPAKRQEDGPVIELDGLDLDLSGIGVSIPIPGDAADAVDWNKVPQETQDSGNGDDGKPTPTSFTAATADPIPVDNGPHFTTTDYFGQVLDCPASAATANFDTPIPQENGDPSCKVTI